MSWAEEHSGWGSNVRPRRHYTDARTTGIPAPDGERPEWECECPGTLSGTTAATFIAKLNDPRLTRCMGCGRKRPG